MTNCYCLDPICTISTLRNAKLKFSLLNFKLYQIKPFFMSFRDGKLGSSIYFEHFKEHWKTKEKIQIFLGLRNEII